MVGTQRVQRAPGVERRPTTRGVAKSTRCAAMRTTKNGVVNYQSFCVNQRMTGIAARSKINLQLNIKKMFLDSSNPKKSKNLACMNSSASKTKIRRET